MEQQDNSQLVLTPDHILEWFRATDTILACERGGVRFVMPSQDAHGTRQVFLTGNIDGAFMAKYFELAEKYHGTRPGALIDAGANIGTTTIHALHSQKGVTHAYAFEPFPLNYQCLRASLCLNALDHRAHVVNTALGDFNGTVTFSIANDNNYGDHRVLFGEEPSAGERYHESSRDTMTVPMMSLNSYFEENPPVDPVRYLWVDTQGCEYFVLAGADKVLQDDTSVQIEFWPYAMQRNESLDRCVSFLKHNFSKFIIVHEVVESGYANLRMQPQDIQYLDYLVEDLLPASGSGSMREAVDLFLLR